MVASDNPIRAASFTNELIDACDRLSDYPLAYPSYRGRSRRPLRQGNCRGYLILFELSPKNVEIVAIVHGARDLDAMDF